jgi:phage terminase large subunit
MKISVEFPEKLQFLFRPSRYKVTYGGRGGAKSWGYARALIFKAMEKKTRILCTREYQISMRESVHRLLSDQIDNMGLSSYFSITQNAIVCATGSEFIFAGLKTNPHTIKSTEGVDICWVEEAEKVSETSWRLLIPTIRQPGSEIWVSFNPDEPTDPTYQRFVKNSPPDAVVVKMTFRDNPWFPPELAREKNYLASVDIDAYAHVWLGECRKRTKAQIMAGKCLSRYFEPGKDWDGPYFGADWGFANDPTTLIKSWIYGPDLFIEYEIYKVGMEIDATPAEFQTIPGSKNHTIRADSARPETISYMQRHGFHNVRGVNKWGGSVEDGIAFLRSFRSIIIHPRCIHTLEESRLYSYKIDRLTEDILPEVVDAHNHCWDAVRYSLEPLIKAVPGAGLLAFYAEEATRIEEERKRTIVKIY